MAQSICLCLMWFYDVIFSLEQFSTGYSEMSLMINTLRQSNMAMDKNKI